MARLYISQKRLDSWTTENKLEVAGDIMTLVELNRSFAIVPAVRFLAVLGDDKDPHELVGPTALPHEAHVHTQVAERLGADGMGVTQRYEGGGPTLAAVSQRHPRNARHHRQAVQRLDAVG